MKSRDFLKALGLTLALPATRVLAQAAPGRPVRVLVPVPTGTANDFVARLLSPGIGQALGQSVVIENKAGANGAIATMEVVRAPADGFTLLCASLSPLATNMAFVKNMAYDPRRDLTPIATGSVTNHVLMVSASSPIHTLADFIAHAKDRPGKVGVGISTTITQLQVASINKLAGVQLMTVPYKGTPPTITDVIGGVLDATLLDQISAMTQARGGRMRALAVSSLKRNPASPEWPAIAETLPGFDFSSWTAFVGPAGMPRELVHRMSAAIAQTQKQAEVLRQLNNQGTLTLTMGPDELKAFIETEVAKYQRLARDADIQPE